MPEKTKEEHESKLNFARTSLLIDTTKNYEVALSKCLNDSGIERANNSEL